MQLLSGYCLANEPLETGAVPSLTAKGREGGDLLHFGSSEWASETLHGGYGGGSERGG